MFNNKTNLIMLAGSMMSISLHAKPVSLFTGKDLDGWKGDPKFWSVQDGCITGKCTAQNPCKNTTYITYTKKEFADFELTLQFRITGAKGNSGIQYRSQWADESKFKIKGYQADIATGNKISGIFYEQDGRGIVSWRGKKVVIDKKGKKTSVALSPNNSDKAQQSMKPGEWNTYRVVANGNLLTHQINGFTTVQVEDNEENRKSAKGLLALQLHKGPPMTVQYKNIMMLELSGPVVAEPLKKTAVEITK